MLSGSSGAAASSMRSFNASATDAHSGSSSTPNTIPARPESAPSTVFERDVAGEPVGDDHVGRRRAGGRGLRRCRPSPSPRRAAATRPCAARRPCRAPRRSRAARRSARRHRGAPGRTRGRAAPTRRAIRAAGRRSRRRRSGAARGPAPNIGSGTAIAGRCTPANPPEPQQRGGHGRPGVAGADERRRRARRCTARAPRTSEESFLVRTAAAGSSSIAITSEAASTDDAARAAVPPGRCAAIASGRPTRRISTSSSAAARTPPATISAGARSPPIASSAITGVTAWPRSPWPPFASHQGGQSTSSTCRPR